MDRTLADKYKIPHLQYVPATRMLACHLQLNAIHTLALVASIGSAFTHYPYFSKFNYNRTDLIFWMCMAFRNQLETAQKTFCHAYFRDLL